MAVEHLDWVSEPLDCMGELRLQDITLKFKIFCQYGNSVAVKLEHKDYRESYVCVAI